MTVSKNFPPAISISIFIQSEIASIRFLHTRGHFFYANSGKDPHLRIDIIQVSKEIIGPYFHAVATASALVVHVDANLKMVG
jgi:hypothetical protein